MTETTAAVPDDEHDAEGSTIGYERARVTALLARVRQEIDDLTDALARATGSPDAAGSPYGRCRTCGGSIGEDRLAALPAAVTCIDCADPSGPGRFRLVR